MTRTRSGAGHLTDRGLPGPLAAALDDVEAGLPDFDAGADPAARSLADDVTRYALGKARDPISQALLSRPAIVAWCVHEAVRRSGDEPRRGRSAYYRTAEPLSEHEAPPEQVAAEQVAAVEVPPEQTETRRTRRSRGDAKEKKS